QRREAGSRTLLPRAPRQVADGAREPARRPEERALSVHGPGAGVRPGVAAGPRRRAGSARGPRRVQSGRRRAQGSSAGARARRQGDPGRRAPPLRSRARHRGRAGRRRGLLQADRAQAGRVQAARARREHGRREPVRNRDDPVRRALRRTQPDLERKTTMTKRTLWILALAAGISARSGPAAEPQRFGGAGADVLAVEVPVQVVRDGHPVRDLTAADFTVFEGRKKQQITGFEVIDLGAKPGAAETGAPPVAIVARRHFLLFFDLLNSEAKSLAKARDAAKT